MFYASARGYLQAGSILAGTGCTSTLNSAGACIHVAVRPLPPFLLDRVSRTSTCRDQDTLSAPPVPSGSNRVDQHAHAGPCIHVAYAPFQTHYGPGARHSYRARARIHLAYPPFRSPRRPHFRWWTIPPTRDLHPSRVIPRLRPYAFVGIPSLRMSHALRGCTPPSA